MKSLAIVRATDILKLKSTLQEMDSAGLTLDGKPKEISIESTENILSKVFKTSDIEFEVCALIPLNQDCILSRNKISDIPPYSDIVVLDSSNDLFNYLTKMMVALPDLVIPSASYKGSGRTGDRKVRTSKVYLSAFVNRSVRVETESDSNLVGILKHADSIGVFLEPLDETSPIFITWYDIKKIIIPKEDNGLNKIK